METKVCYSCKQEKEVSNFYRSNRQYFQKECKVCCKERKFKWHQTESGKLSSKRTKLKRFFGLSLETYNEMSEIQNHVCAICRQPETHLNHQLSVDHCHTTGKIRALLCRNCNLALGNLKDDPSLMRKAAEYIEKHKGVA